jgi:hypothetical protein
MERIYVIAAALAVGVAIGSVVSQVSLRPVEAPQRPRYSPDLKPIKMISSKLRKLTSANVYWLRASNLIHLVRYQNGEPRLERMPGGWKHQVDETARKRCGLIACIVGCFLAIAIVVPNPPMPAGTVPHEGTSEVSIRFASREQAPENLSNHALACHMHFEHHQLVRSANPFLIPAREPGRACFLTRVNLFSSLEPAPPEKPPRV